MQKLQPLFNFFKHAHIMNENTQIPTEGISMLDKLKKHLSEITKEEFAKEWHEINEIVEDEIRERFIDDDLYD